MKKSNVTCKCCSKEITSRNDLVLTFVNVKPVSYCSSCYSKELREREPISKEAIKLKLRTSVMVSVLFAILLAFHVDFRFFTFMVLWAVAMDLHRWSQTNKFHKEAHTIRSHYIQYGHYNTYLHAYDNRSNSEKVASLDSLNSASYLQADMNNSEYHSTLSTFANAKIALENFFDTLYQNIFSERKLPIINLVKYPVGTVLYLISAFALLCLLCLIGLQFFEPVPLVDIIDVIQ